MNLSTTLRRGLMLTLLLSVALIGTAQGAPRKLVGCSDLLVNGGFEAGNTGWSQWSSGGYDLISQFYPRSGVWGAYLGGANGADDRLSQDMTLPAGASITLRGWWTAESEELTPGSDMLTLSLLQINGVPLVDLWTMDNTAAGAPWSEVAIDLSSYAGQAVTLRWRATTNQFDLTDFYLDDLSLEVCITTSSPPRSFLPLVFSR